MLNHYRYSSFYFCPQDKVSTLRGNQGQAGGLHQGQAGGGNQLGRFGLQQGQAGGGNQWP